MIPLTAPQEHHPMTLSRILRQLANYIPLQLTPIPVRIITAKKDDYQLTPQAF